MAKKKSILDLQRMKEEGEKTAWLTIYDYPTASFAEQAGIDMILVGDSLGMAVKGLDGTESVTLEDILFCCEGVRRGAPNVFCIGDLPFMSYQVSTEEAIRNAGRLIKEGKMDAVKLEGGRRVTEQVRGIVDAGIVVFGHIGLTPQSSGQLGGFKAQGLYTDSAEELIKDAIALEEAGISALILEAVPPEVATFITKKLKIPVYGIGAGSECDGQTLLSCDLLGLFQAFTPKFVKEYANIAEVTINAFKKFVEEVNNGEFPTEEHVYHIKEPKEEFEKLFDKYR